jgi:hypothetical protein
MGVAAAGARITLNPVKSPDSAADTADPEVAAAVRLLHRRRGWAWATVVGVVAFLVACGLLGSLAPNASGAGLGVASVFILLLAAVAVVGLVASVVDTVRLHRLDRGVRAQARARTAHHPVRAHAYRYPPRHRWTWVFGWLVMVILLGLGVATLPALVDGVAYLAGAENTATFYPTSYGQDCGRSGCSTVTNGFLGSGSAAAAATWPGQVPLGLPFTVREPAWNWGFGSQLIDGDGTAIAYIVVGVLMDGFAGFILFALYKVVRQWVRRRRAPVGSGLVVG